MFVSGNEIMIQWVLHWMSVRWANPATYFYYSSRKKHCTVTAKLQLSSLLR